MARWWGGSYRGLINSPVVGMTYDRAVEVMEDVTAVYAGQWANYAIDRSGTLWGMEGDTGSRLLGAYYGEARAESVPILEEVSSIAQYSEVCAMVKQDNALWEVLADEQDCTLRQIGKQVSYTAWMYAWDCFLCLDQNGVLRTLASDGSGDVLTDGIRYPA